VGGLGEYPVCHTKVSFFVSFLFDFIGSRTGRTALPFKPGTKSTVAEAKSKAKNVEIWPQGQGLASRTTLVGISLLEINIKQSKVNADLHSASSRTRL